MKETLEEAAEKILSKEGIKLHPSGLETYLKGNAINAMVEMAKWQQEDMIEKLEMHILVNEHDWNRNPQAQFRDFIEQFKK